MITVLSAGDVDSLDPAVAYGTYSIGLLGALQRRLFTYGPGDAAAPQPDLAEAAPEISADGRTVRVRIRRGVRFSSPVDREVTAGDVKYAIERAFTANVAGPYVHPTSARSSARRSSSGGTSRLLESRRRARTSSFSV